MFPLALLLSNSAIGAPTDNRAQQPSAAQPNAAQQPSADQPNGAQQPSAAQQSGITQPNAAQQPSAAQQSGTAQQLIDVVVMKDGRLLRGNITQLAPGQFVIIRMASGELQKIALSDTSYAGPIINMPELATSNAAHGSTPSAVDARPQPTTPRDPQTIPATTDGPGSGEARPVTTRDLEYAVAFEGNEPGLTLHVRTDAAGSTDVEGYRALCTAPCSVKLRPRAYRFGVGRGATVPMPTEETVFVREPIRLLAKVHDYETTRTVGFVTLAVSGALLFASTIALASDCTSLDPKRCGTIGSLAIFPLLPLSVAGAVVGIVLGTKNDWAEIVQVPNVARPLGDARLNVSGRF